MRGTVFEPPGGFYKNRILIKICFKPIVNPLKAVQNHVKLSFLSAAFDPQEIVQRSQIYEGFMPIFGSDEQLEYAYFSGFTHFY